jgi:hypothetical protein
MGNELRLRAHGGRWPPEVVSPETFLARLPRRVVFPQDGLTWTSPGPGAIEVRTHADPSTMPNVRVVVEQGGFYLLDNDATLASLVLGELVRYLVGSFESVTITEP